MRPLLVGTGTKRQSSQAVSLPIHLPLPLPIRLVTKRRLLFLFYLIALIILGHRKIERRIILLSSSGPLPLPTRPTTIEYTQPLTHIYKNNILHNIHALLHIMYICGIAVCIHVSIRYYFYSSVFVHVFEYVNVLYIYIIFIL